jgi:hypothetical protein
MQIQIQWKTKIVLAIFGLRKIVRLNYKKSFVIKTTKTTKLI